MAEEKKDAAPPAPPEAAAPPTPAEKGKETKPGKGGKGAGAQKNKIKEIIAAMSPREKSVGKVSAVVMSLLFLDLLVIHPLSGYLKHLDETIRTQESLVPKRLQVLKHKDRIVKEFRSFEPYFTDPAKAEEEGIASFLRELERVSKLAGLQVSNTNPVKTDKKSEMVLEYSVDIEGKASLEALRQFLRTLEAANAGIRVAGFSLKPQGKDSDEIKFTFSVAKIGVKKQHVALLD